jgi:hypothetical protein
MRLDDPRHPVHRIGRAVTLTLAGGLLVLGLGLLPAACSPSVTREPAPTVTDPATVRNAVARLCHAFHAYTVDDLARPAVEADVEYLAGLQGVPDGLRKAAVGYWNEPGVRDLNATHDADEPSNRAIANDRYGAVSAACNNHGWKREKASDQPPKK